MAAVVCAANLQQLLDKNINLTKISSEYENFAENGRNIYKLKMVIFILFEMSKIINNGSGHFPHTHPSPWKNFVHYLCNKNICRNVSTTKGVE